MTNGQQTQSHTLSGLTEHVVDQIKARIDVFGFALWPLTPDSEHGIPAGFNTIGFTKLGIPEFYVSGIPAYSQQANELIQGLRELYDHIRDNSLSLTPQQLCDDINGEIAAAGGRGVYQWRPVDPTRMMYGQCLTLRHWADSVGLTDIVTGIQIVHRPDVECSFPMVSTPEQLLLEWVPFGVK